MEKLYVSLDNENKIIYASLDKDKLNEYTKKYLSKILKRNATDDDFKIVEEILV